MASAPTHVVATGALAACMYRSPVPWHFWMWGVVLAVAPDLDVIGFRFGIAYEDMLGHRGLTHSLPMAAVASGILIASRYRFGAGALTRMSAFWFLFLAAALHGVLDAFTDSGLGVAFFAPFSGRRYFFPVRPLAVSPLSIRGFLTSDGLTILANEARWVWIPAIVTATSVSWYRGRRRASRDG